MEVKNSVNTNVFKYFDEISKIPHGSGNMTAIADYIVDFAKCHNLKYYRDEANNVIIYKKATSGYENAQPVILQGHLDMVCQKTTDSNIDFLNDGISVFRDGDFLKADGTTLGGDNGIAVAMILSVLESDNISHPDIEAVFTTDEEIGMLGAVALDMGKLSSKQMINLDSEEDDTLTVSCAGGSDFTVEIPVTFKTTFGTSLLISLHSLKGGHSGVDINKGRQNADILVGDLLTHLKNECNFSIISIDGGDKANAIPCSSAIKLCTQNPIELIDCAKAWYNATILKLEGEEPDFSVTVKTVGDGECFALCEESQNKIIDFLSLAPNGVIKMSDEIEGLVETSLNLGVLKTKAESVFFHFALRSNKDGKLLELENEMKKYSLRFTENVKIFGKYPAWEYKSDSNLQSVYKNHYKQINGKEPKVEAIHAGLECAVFASRIKGLDCISMGPNLFDVHTVNEKLSISSTQKTYMLLTQVLKGLKYN